MIVLETTESLKSITVFKVASEPTSDTEAADHRNRDGLPFAVTMPPPGKTLNHALCLVTSNLISTLSTSETKLICLSDQRIANIEHRNGRDALVLQAEAVDQDEQWVYLLSTPNSCRNGVFLTRFVDKNEGSSHDFEDIMWLCGKRGRGFRDGGAGEAMFNHLKMGKSFSCPPISSSPLRPRCNRVLAVYDQGNYAIRLIDTDELSGSFGTVRTICGGGIPGYADGSSEESLLRDVGGMLWSHNGDALIFSDTANHALRVIRRVHQFESLFLDKFEVLSLIGPSSNSSLRFGLVDGEIPSALCRFPCGLAPAVGGGSFYFADRGNNAVRIVNLSDGTVRTVLSTDDYEEGAPVPLGLVEPTQVLPLKQMSPSSSGNTFALLIASASQRTVSMVMSSSLPVPSVKRQQASGNSSSRLEALFQPGEVYLTIHSDTRQSRDTLALRLRRNSAKRHVAPLNPPRSSSATRRFGAMYNEIERERARHDEDARVRDSVTRSTTPKGRHYDDASGVRCSSPKTPLPRNRSASARSPFVGSQASPKRSTHTPVQSHCDPHVTPHEPNAAADVDCSALHMLYNAHATTPASVVEQKTDITNPHVASEFVAVEGGNMSMIGFWHFMVLTNAIRGNIPQLVENLCECYTSAIVKEGYKVKSQMSFERFFLAVCRFNGVKDMNAVHVINSAVQQIVRVYCTNASSPSWAERRLVLDLIAANEKSLRMLFEAYANTVDRGEHVGRVPFLRFQSLLHTVHLYPSLLTNYRVKALFGDAMRGSLFAVDPQLPPSSKAATTDLKRAVDEACRSGSMNFFHFVDAIVRVALTAFGEQSVVANVFSEEMIVARRLEMLFEWMNVEIRTMEPSTTTAERLKNSNAVASAVFPSRVPLFVVSQKGNSTNAPGKLRDASVQPADVQKEGLPISSDLGKDLRHMRRVQDSLNTSSR